MTNKKYIVACDLGTGGNKAALFAPNGECLAEHFAPYDTFFPKETFHEQRPQDWLDAVVSSVRSLMASVDVSPENVAAISISGHSLGCVPLDAQGQLLQAATPIWSDHRASIEAEAFFTKVPEDEWYFTTGNGFPPVLYTVFKVMWLRQHAPEVFENTAAIVGTKDYVNFKLSGQLSTDYSYASGTGIYDLNKRSYDPRLLEASGLDGSLFLSPVASTDVIGTLTASASEALGLPQSVKVIAGGVDNSCMALGAGNVREGSVYHSLGSSSWLTVTTAQPVLDPRARPFVFAHVIPGMFNSALSTFSSGTSLNWMRDLLTGVHGGDPISYDDLFRLAQTAPAGANNLLFIPTLAGGTMLEGGPNARGGLFGLSLSHTHADILRATLEGIAFSLRIALDCLRSVAPVASEMIVVGGGAQNAFWRQIYADVYGMDIIKTNVDKNAGALGAAALGFVGTGIWEDFSPMLTIHKELSRAEPRAAIAQHYQNRLEVFREVSEFAAKLGHNQVNLET